MTRFAQEEGVYVWLQAQISRWSYIVMAAVFALSTPLGVAIGLGVQSTYSEKSPTALGVQGVFDSVAAGAPLDYSPCLVMPLKHASYCMHASAQLTQPLARPGKVFTAPCHNFLCHT